MAHMKILVVDDEKKIADVLSQRLTLRGFDATPVYDGRTALLLLRSDSFDGMILDLRLPDIDGVEVLRKTLQALPHMRIVILSGHADEHTFETCLELGAIACFNKPGKISELEAALTQKSEKRDESN
ncbi:MAG: response regulator [Deltaproteobacteria bacterium]|nr:response regulator [Deltaproteobacteria bacterium]